MPQLESRIFTEIIEMFPNIRDRNMAVIMGWIADGCSLIRHIMPTIKSAKERGIKPDSFAYFTPAIYKLKKNDEFWKRCGIFHPQHNPSGGKSC